jgi:hypothetical protein
MGSEHSGKFGVLDGQSTVRNWNVNEVSAPQTFITSNTGGGTGRRRGVKDWNGGFAQWGATPLVMPGEAFAFAGYTAPDDDVSGTGETFTGNAIIDQVVIDWNWETGAIIGTTYTFSGDGPLTKGSGTYTDATTPDAPESCGTKIEYDVAIATPVWVEWEKLVSASLTITAANQTVINSGTANWTERRGGNIDWSLAVVQDDVDRDAQTFDIDDEGVQFKVYIDSTDYWLLKYGIIRDFTGIETNIETGAIIRQTCNVDMNAHDLTNGLGGITLPGAGAAWWGV